MRRRTATARTRPAGAPAVTAVPAAVHAVGPVPAGAVTPAVPAAVLAAVLAAFGLGACGGPPTPAATVAAFTAAIDRQDYVAATALTDPPATALAPTYRAMRSDLEATAVTITAGAAVAHGGGAAAPLTTVGGIAAYGPLVLHSTLQLHLVGGHWRVAWSPAAVTDGFVQGDRFTVATAFGPRAQVLGAGGAPLTVPGVSVGLVGSRITGPAALTALLTGAGFPSATVEAAEHAAAARPTQLVPVGVLPTGTYDAIKARTGTTLYSIGGTAFSTGVQAPLTPELGAHLIGTVGPITADALTRLGAPYRAVDQVGQDGIEGQDERALAGTPSVTIRVLGPTGAVVSTLGTRPGTPGTPVSTTIDPVVQQAADTAMAGVAPATQAAMVVERASTGEVLAAVSLPVDAPFDVALEARVPPGSTFKVVTATALLQAGATPATPTTCPATRTVDGQVFRNFESEASPTPTLAKAFALSCNTAFIGLAAALPAAALPQTAALYGLGSTPRLGVPVAASTVPAPVGANQLAATAIGQAGVTVSPLAMASVAATVDSGSYHPPRLVTGAPDDAAAAAPLPAGIAADLRTLMAGVVTSGTAAGAGLPPGTYGKTGTAEFGPGPTPQTHAWFIGFRGDLAFAVFVYGGGVGGTVAAPIAAKLLSALPAGYGALGG